MIEKNAPNKERTDETDFEKYIRERLKLNADQYARYKALDPILKLRIDLDASYENYANALAGKPESLEVDADRIIAARMFRELDAGKGEVA